MKIKNNGRGCITVILGVIIVLFATNLILAEIFIDGHEDGYSEGYEAGFDDGADENARLSSSSESGSSAKSEQTVYVTKTGTKYHRAGCDSLSKSKIPMSLSDAEDDGYTPCSKCY